MVFVPRPLAICAWEKFLKWLSRWSIEDIIIYVRFSSNYEMYRSLYDYTGKDKGVLPLRVGEKFRFIEQHDANWWKMRSQNGSVGLVPACYLEAVDRVSVRRTPFWYLACVIVKWLVCWQLFTIQFFRHFYLFGYVVENLNLVTSLFAFLKTCLAIYFTALRQISNKIFGKISAQTR